LLNGTDLIEDNYPKQVLLEVILKQAYGFVKTKDFLAVYTEVCVLVTLEKHP
jgi:hypothetical protein